MRNVWCVGRHHKLEYSPLSFVTRGMPGEMHVGYVRGRALSALGLILEIGLEDCLNSRGSEVSSCQRPHAHVKPPRDADRAPLAPPVSGLLRVVHAWQ